MVDGRQRVRPVSQAVRGAFETLKRRLKVKAPAVRRTWEASLDVEVPAPRTVGELIGSSGTHGVSVDDLLYLSYCRGVSPALILRLAWRQEPWPFLKLASHSQARTAWSSQRICPAGCSSRRGERDSAASGH